MIHNETRRRETSRKRPFSRLVSSSTARAAVGVVVLAATMVGCVEREVVVARPGRACPGGAWIAGHYGPGGYWHPAHWRCPGVVEVVE